MDARDSQDAYNRIKKWNITDYCNKKELENELVQKQILKYFADK